MLARFEMRDRVVDMPPARFARAIRACPRRALEILAIKQRDRLTEFVVRALEFDRTIVSMSLLGHSPVAHRDLELHVGVARVEIQRVPPRIERVLVLLKLEVRPTGLATPSHAERVAPHAFGRHSKRSELIAAVPKGACIARAEAEADRRRLIVGAG